MTETLASHLADETLNEYLDEALPRAARAQADAHLAGCAACADRLAALRTLFASLEALPEVALERDLARAVTVALRRSATPSRIPTSEPRHPLYRLIFPVQALAALFLLAMAWPLGATQLGALTRLTVPAVSLWTALLASTEHVLDLAPAPAQLLASLQRGTQSWLSVFQAGPAFDVPITLWLAVAGGVGLLWLLSHAWLLQHPQRRHVRRRS